MKKVFGRLFKEEEGQALTEYGLLVGLIALAVVTAVWALGGRLDTLFRNIVTGLGGTVN